ncbi:MAG: hypothetical protein SGI77_19470 [Pirellulaceae bacterium]|nr:hypothetical protein [Pirellulaceae bacterium]
MWTRRTEGGGSCRKGRPTAVCLDRAILGDDHPQEAKDSSEAETGGRLSGSLLQGGPAGRFDHGRTCRRMGHVAGVFWQQSRGAGAKRQRWQVDPWKDVAVGKHRSTAQRAMQADS